MKFTSFSIILLLAYIADALILLIRLPASQIIIGDLLFCLILRVIYVLFLLLLQLLLVFLVFIFILVIFVFEILVIEFLIFDFKFFFPIIVPAVLVVFVEQVIFLDDRALRLDYVLKIEDSLLLNLKVDFHFDVLQFQHVILDHQLEEVPSVLELDFLRNRVSDHLRVGDVFQ